MTTEGRIDTIFGFEKVADAAAADQGRANG
jgi:hypothetical protein